MLNEETKAAGRYVVDQFYMGQFLVVDTEYGEAVAVCPELDDYGWDAKCTTKDAKDRAQAICDGLNKTSYDWHPPGDFVHWSDQ